MATSPQRFRAMQYREAGFLFGLYLITGGKTAGLSTLRHSVPPEHEGWKQCPQERYWRTHGFSKWGTCWVMGEHTIITLVMWPARGTESCWWLSGHWFDLLCTENNVFLCIQRPWGRKGAGVVLQVNERARKKIQASAHLIWSLAVGCSHSTCFCCYCCFLLWVFLSYISGNECFPEALASKAVPLQQS